MLVLAARAFVSPAEHREKRRSSQLPEGMNGRRMNASASSCSRSRTGYLNDLPDAVPAIVEAGVLGEVGVYDHVT